MSKRRARAIVDMPAREPAIAAPVGILEAQVLTGDGTGEALPDFDAAADREADPVVDAEDVAEDVAYLAAVVAAIAEPEPVRMGLVEDGHTKHGVRKLRVGPITDRSHSHAWERWYQDGTPGYYCRACQSFMTRAEAGR